MYLITLLAKTKYEKIINKCNNGKAASPQDYIYYEYIKHTKDNMLPIYIVTFSTRYLTLEFCRKNWLIGTIRLYIKRKALQRIPKTIGQ